MEKKGWFVDNFPVTLRRRFVAVCKDQGTTVTEVLEPFVRAFVTKYSTFKDGETNADDGTGKRGS